jgi:hypothetical protein
MTARYKKHFSFPNDATDDYDGGGGGGCGGRGKILRIRNETRNMIYISRLRLLRYTQLFSGTEHCAPADLRILR